MLSLIGMFLEITAFQLTKWNVTGSWWRYQMEIFCALLAICAGNSPVTGEFPAQRPVTRSFDVFFDLRLNKRLSKRWWGWWFETPLHPLWRRCNDAISNDATQGLRRHELKFFFHWWWPCKNEPGNNSHGSSSIVSLHTTCNSISWLSDIWPGKLITIMTMGGGWILPPSPSNIYMVCGAPDGMGTSVFQNFVEDAWWLVLYLGS